MSLFGEDDSAPSRPNRSSLFDDETTPGKGSSSLFDDGDDDGLGLPAPRKQQQESHQPLPSTPQKQTQTAEQSSVAAQQQQQQQTTPSTGMGRSSYTTGGGFDANDPWGSPQAQRSVPARQPSDMGWTAPQAQPDTIPGSAGNSAWEASAERTNGTSWDTSEDASASTAVRSSRAPRTTASKGQEEVVTVNLLEEKEGVFMFQHRNYEVASVRRASKVIRRYSDFVWLLDCLHKRYPFRQLPLLPPKRVAINGNHIAADSLFLEKRRRGLARFANALVRHPVLREEQLVVMFLTVPTELAVWRKQATISVQEEFVGKSLPPDLEDSLPKNLQDTFDTVRSGVRRSAELYINLCNITERLCKRKEAIATEYSRFSINLTGLTDTSADTYAIDPNDVPLLNEGINATAKHLGTSQTLLEDEARAWDEGLLEDLKTVRDGLVSMRDMFDRRDRYAKDNIPQLERRIQTNEQKLQNIKAKGDAAKPGEAEKVETAIVNDKQSIVNQHARGVFIQECVRDELHYFQSTQYRISRVHQDWAQERVKYSELQADNFRGLVDAVESMPLGD